MTDAAMPDATGERERRWLMLKLLGRVRAHMTDVVETGKLADHWLAELRHSS
jgi:hypothetical protein